jgi:hypothetical protein
LERVLSIQGQTAHGGRNYACPHPNFPGVKVNLSKSGISHTSYLFKNDDEDEKETKQEERASEDADDKPKRRSKEQASSPWGFFLFVFIALFFFYFGADALGLLPPNFLTNILQTLAHWARQVGL